MNIVKQYPVHEYMVSLNTGTVSLCKTIVTAEVDEQGDMLHEKRLWRLALNAGTPGFETKLAEHFDPSTTAFLLSVLQAAPSFTTETEG